VDGIEIVEAGIERLEEIEPLWTSLSEHHAELTPAELPIRPPADGWPIRRRIYRDGLEDGAALFFAERDGKAVGFAFAHPRPAPTNVAIDRIVDVETVAVLPEARGAGVGSALMDAVEAWADAHDFELLQVSVRNANEGAWRLYERRGFKPLYTTMVARRTGS
jgi:ribosomal protein S18 acetylase RimI-like enzyme